MGYMKKNRCVSADNLRHLTKNFESQYLSYEQRRKEEDKEEEKKEKKRSWWQKKELRKDPSCSSTIRKRWEWKKAF